jgi:hypothetical protein
MRTDPLALPGTIGTCEEKEKRRKDILKIEKIFGKTNLLVYTHHSVSVKLWPKPLERTKGSKASWSSGEILERSNVFFTSQHSFYKF